MTLPYPIDLGPASLQQRNVLNSLLLRREIDVLGWRWDGTNLALRYRAPFTVPWVQVQIQSTTTGGLSYNPAVFISSTLVDCRASRVQDVTLATPSAALRYAIFLIPVQYDAAGTKILYDGQSGRPDNISFVGDPRPTLPAPHAIATTTTIGPEHTVSGLISGQVLIASSATNVLFRVLTAADIGAGTFGAGAFTFPSTLTVSGLLTASNGVTVATTKPLLWSADNAAGSTVGASGASRPYGGYFGTEVVIGADPLSSETASVIRAAGHVMISNNSQFKTLDSAGGSRALLFLDGVNPDVLHLRNNQRGVGGAINIESLTGGGIAAFWASTGVFTQNYAATITGKLTAGAPFTDPSASAILAAGPISINATGDVLFLNATRSASTPISIAFLGSTGANDVRLQTSNNGRLATTNAGFDVTGTFTVSSTATISGLLTLNGGATLPSGQGIGFGASPVTTASIFVDTGYSIAGDFGRGVLIRSTFASSNTTEASVLYAQPRTAAAAFTVTAVDGLRVTDAVKGAGSAITTLYGLRIDSITAGGTNYAIKTGTGQVSFGDVVAISGLLTASAGISVQRTDTEPILISGNADAASWWRGSIAYTHTGTGARTWVMGAREGKFQLSDETAGVIRWSIDSAGLWTHNYAMTVTGPLVVGTDPGGSDIVRVGGSVTVNAASFSSVTWRVGGAVNGQIGVDGGPTLRFFLGATPTEYLGLTTAAFRPFAAAGLTLGTSALPWGAVWMSEATMIHSKTTFTNGAGALTGTLTNAPATGNPTKWIPVDDNGTTRYIPAW